MNQQVSSGGDLFLNGEDILSVVNVISGEETTITGVSELISRAMWSPDGRYAILEGKDYYLWDGEQRTTTQLDFPATTVDAITTDRNDALLGWSPDGEFALMQRPDTHQPYILHVKSARLIPQAPSEHKYLNWHEDSVYWFDVRWLNGTQFQYFTKNIEQKYILTTCDARTDTCVNRETETEGWANIFMELTNESHNQRYYASISDGTTIYDRIAKSSREFRPPPINPAAVSGGHVEWHSGDEWLIGFRNAFEGNQRMSSAVAVIKRDGTVRRDIPAGGHFYGASETLNWLPERVKPEHLPVRTKERLYTAPDVVIPHFTWVKNLLWSPDSTQIATIAPRSKEEHYLSGKVASPDVPAFKALFYMGGDESLVWNEDGFLFKEKTAQLTPPPPPPPQRYKATPVPAGEYKRTIAVTDANNGAEICRVPNFSDWELGMMFSPDHQLLVIGLPHDRTEVWDISTCTQKAVLGGSNVFAFSPDGRWLAVAHTWDVDLYRTDRFR